MQETSHPSFIAFDGTRRIASGALALVALAVAKALKSKSAGPVLVFDDRTGGVVDIDSRGTDAEILARLPASQASDSATDDADRSDVQTLRGRGRPKLGVVAREVTLLPRHWDWLATQSGGASVALRRLVEDARRAQRHGDGSRERQERAYKFMSAMAGDLAGFEEASRALFAGDEPGFRERIAEWPADVRDHATRLACSTE